MRGGASLNAVGGGSLNGSAKLPMASVDATRLQVVSPSWMLWRWTEERGRQRLGRPHGRRGRRRGGGDGGGEGDERRICNARSTFCEAGSFGKLRRSLRRSPKREISYGATPALLPGAGVTFSWRQIQKGVISNAGVRPLGATEPLMHIRNWQTDSSVPGPLGSRDWMADLSASRGPLRPTRKPSNDASDWRIIRWRHGVSRLDLDIDLPLLILLPPPMIASFPARTPSPYSQDSKKFPSARTITTILHWLVLTEEFYALDASPDPAIFYSDSSQGNISAWLLEAPNSVISLTKLPYGTV